MSAFDETIQDQIVSESNINSLEKYKFIIDSDGLVRIRTQTSIDGAVEGSFAPSGLKSGGQDKYYIAKDDKWYKLADEIGVLSPRNSLRIQNQGEVDLLTTLNQDPNLTNQAFGIKVFAGGSDFLDITDDINSYWVKSTSGDLPLIIREIG